MIKTTYTLTEAEYYEAQMSILRFREPGQFRKRRNQIVRLSLLAAFVLAMPIYFSIKFGNVLWLSPITAICALAFEVWVFYLVYDLITLRATKNRLRKLYKQVSEGEASVHLQVDETGWHDETPGGSTTFVEWPAFSNWIETDSLILVLRRTLLFHYRSEARSHVGRTDSATRSGIEPCSRRDRQPKSVNRGASTLFV